MQTKTFEVPNISCKHCVMTVQNEVSEINGVQSVNADEQSRMVTVSWDDPANWDQIKDLLAEINYPPSES